MSQKFERVELQVVPGGRQVPAHPAFQQAFEALPNLDAVDPHGRALKGRPWGVPMEVWLSGDDLTALGVPSLRDLQIREGILRARLLTTRTKKLGELPLVTEILVPKAGGVVPAKWFLLAGVMGLRSSRAHARREHRNDLRLWQWRCRAHEDCLATPELGIACLAQRPGGLGFVSSPSGTR